MFSNPNLLLYVFLQMCCLSVKRNSLYQHRFQVCYSAILIMSRMGKAVSIRVHSLELRCVTLLPTFGSIVFCPIESGKWGFNENLSRITILLLAAMVATTMILMTTAIVIVFLPSFLIHVFDYSRPFALFLSLDPLIFNRIKCSQLLGDSLR